jgi:hypothetical protein
MSAEFNIKVEDAKLAVAARKDEIAKLVEQTLEGLIEEALVVGDTGRMEFDLVGARKVIVAALTSYEEERIPPSAIRALAEAVAINDAAGPGNDPIAMALVIRAARDLVHGVALQEGPSGEGWQPPAGPSVIELSDELRGRVSSIERASDGGNKGRQCVECGEWSGEHHDHCQVVFYRDLLAVLDSLPPPKGQNAKDATPPASSGEGAT